MSKFCFLCTLVDPSGPLKSTSAKEFNDLSNNLLDIQKEKLDNPLCNDYLQTNNFMKPKKPPKGYAFINYAVHNETPTYQHCMSQHTCNFVYCYIPYDL